ncbi:MAG: hypothetical protein ABW219_01460, partial [Ilumatobacteraceae bacterium]
MTDRRRRSGAARRLVLVTLLVACDGGSDDAPLAESLCPTVRAWSDSTVDAVNAFRIASRGLDPVQRRARYLEAFDDVAALRDRMADELGDQDLSGAVGTRLGEAVDDVATVIEDGASEATSLPDAAYDVVAVREGSLVTGVEKAKAIMFNTLADLADEPGTDVPR